MKKELEEEIEEFGVYHAHNIFFINYNKDKKSTSLTDVVNYINERLSYSKIKFDTKDQEILDKIEECINKDQLYFADYRIKDDIIKRINYRPVKTKFYTSGKIIVENDLREFFKDCDCDVNQTKGIIQTIKHFAKQKMLHGFVGNSCPSLYLSKKHNEILIGVDYDEKTDEPIFPDNTYKRLTSVCTDLWWC